VLLPSPLEKIRQSSRFNQKETRNATGGRCNNRFCLDREGEYKLKARSVAKNNPTCHPEEKRIDERSDWII
jgi:hypothetical protein